MAVEEAMAVMGLSNGKVLYLTGRLGEDEVEASIEDPDILGAIEHFSRPVDGIVSLLKIGSAAFLTSAAGVDMSSLRMEIDRAVAEASKAISEAALQVERMVSPEGALALRGQEVAAEIVAELRDAIAREGDSTQQGTLVARVNSAADRIQTVLAASRCELADELRKGLQHQAETLHTVLERVLLSPDADNPLGQALRRIESALLEMRAAAAAREARTAEAEKGHMKGVDYEKEIAKQVGLIASMAGDRAEHTGAQDGQAITSRRPSHKGDVTVSLAAGVPDQDLKIVVEVMRRGPGELSAKKVTEELSEARNNRSAQGAIAVLSSSDNPVMCGQTVSILNPQTWAVVVEPEGSVVPLATAYRMVRYAVIAAARRKGTLDVERLREFVDDVNRDMAMIKTARAQMETSNNAQRQAMLNLGDFERSIQARIGRINGFVSGKPTIRKAS